MPYSFMTISIFAPCMRQEVEDVCTEVSRHFFDCPSGTGDKIISEAVRIINDLSDEMDEAEEEIRDQFSRMRIPFEQNLAIQTSFENMIEIKERILDQLYIIQQVTSQ